MKHQFKLAGVHAQNGFKILAAVATGKLEAISDAVRVAYRKLRFVVIRLMAPFRAK